MRYEAVKHYSIEEVDDIMFSGDENMIKLLPLSICEYNDDFDFAQNFCLGLLDTDNNDEIHANAALGLSYLVRRFRRFDKAIMSRLQKELEENKAFHERVEYSIDDINTFMNW